MGKFVTVFGIWMLISLLMLSYQQSISIIDPSRVLTGAIFGDDNPLNYALQTSNNNTISYNSSSAILPTRSSTGADTGGIQYPDWTQSSFSWASVYKPLINFIGTPYFFVSWMFPGDNTAAMWGIFFTILNLVLLVFVLSGRID